MITKEDIKEKLKDYVKARHDLLSAIHLSNAKEIVVYVNMVDDLFNPIITLASGECEYGGNCTNCENFLQFSPSSSIRKLTNPKLCSSCEGESAKTINLVNAICLRNITNTKENENDK